MKEDFEQELINALLPYIKDQAVEDAKMRITTIIGKYEITKRETYLAVYEGDINEVIVKRFLMAKIAKGCTPRTIGYYKQSITIALEKIGKPYNEITSDDIRLYLAKRVQRDKVSKTTANNERSNLSAFYTWLQKEEILLKNPMSKVEGIKETKKKKKAFSQMELEQIRYNCKSSMEIALVEVLISTWARVSEVAQMRVDEITDNSIVVHGKGDKEREVFLNPKARLAVQRYIDERSDDNPYIFPKAKYAGDVKEMTRSVPRKLQAEWYKDPDLVGEGHRDKSTIESDIRRLGKRAGVQNAHPHRFRRTGATMALLAGMPLTTVSKLLGHESIATTQIYLDISDKELQQAHEKFVI